MFLDAIKPDLSSIADSKILTFECEDRQARSGTESEQDALRTRREDERSDSKRSSAAATAGA